MSKQVTNNEVVQWYGALGFSPEVSGSIPFTTGDLARAAGKLGLWLSREHGCSTSIAFPPDWWPGLAFPTTIKFRPRRRKNQRIGSERETRRNRQRSQRSAVAGHDLTKGEPRTGLGWVGRGLCTGGAAMSSSWNSVGLEVLYQVLGWVAFFAWSFSFYPQVLLNYKRKSVVGLNFDFLVLNLTKHSSYLIYNVAMFFSPFIQRQYHDKYGDKEMIPVAANDVAFSLHAVALTSFTVFQVFIYERGIQKVSKVCISITAIVWTAAIVCLIIAWPKSDWLWLIDVFNSIQVGMTAIKYIPQAIMNFRRKSTIGWSIGNILLDLTGGVLNFGQMGVQSIDQHTMVNFYGNIGKTLLSLETVFFDVLFIIQHYVLYPAKKDENADDFPVLPIDVKHVAAQ
uniref:Cystinosin homolog n=2 Tax=Setaria italica TaxID=4555 RepID=K4AAW1_SETIT